MVESTGVSLPTHEHGEEESKEVKKIQVPQKLYMAGTVDQSIEHVKKLLERIDLNPLELGLIERFMKDPETVK